MRRGRRPAIALVIFACVQASTSHKEATDLSELTIDVATVMRHVFTSTGRDFFAGVEERGLTFTQVKLLNSLEELSEPCSIGALSERIGLSPAAVSRAVDGLVQRGDVARQEDPCDRRSRLVALTAQGRRTFEQLHACGWPGCASCSPISTPTSARP